MKKVLAQGVFDILHPGHIHYLEKSKELGDKLIVVVARDSRIKERKDTHFNEQERKKMLNSLETVDKAILGSKSDIYTTVKEIDPDIITLGYDQKHDEEEVKKMGEKATGHKVKVKRINKKGDYSSSNIK